ncbi:multiple sugar transport system ATP-binding protein [Defluviimonas denitrificans]|jgi:multiple sugar transport system ATP-binding protein|uniref:Multiple sugar transport system ATP-binding protein n=1 Tax=Albidovulum denitrificans TaxID=404881 RepID=A0A2S8S3J4_9RHOB|nr:sn-glycerol-3-phosphate ABC transporter ATP-binding protein UgpC [Defluviimonas denitrificans]PQV55380.1 multiple sugar transport system ATP-binding protein [Defluviimonas denitrificans]HQU67386.1 sn-glycerol-3-phosphate ABC transporter ATP-binding protein UgpC [Albidovulum sp.]
MAYMQIKGIAKRYGTYEAVRGIDIDIAEREFVVIVGPSGCGKSTLLRMIAGLETISRGDLVIDGQRMNDVRPADRGIAMVFQSYALYPHKTVEQNMGFALKVAKTPKDEAARKIARAAEILQLGPLLKRLPKELSGGQRQRVAIGRAIVRNPKVFLFDEPLSNLDASLRLQMRIELAQLHRELQATMVYVTHDQIEAMTLADKIVVLRDGLVEQIGAPLEIYRRPANTFVAGFIGSPKMNLLKARVTATVAGQARVDAAGLVCDVAVDHLPVIGAEVTLGIRPEHLAAGPGAPVQVQASERLGGVTYAYARLPDGQSLTVQLDGEHDFAADGGLTVQPQPGRAHLFSGDSGLRL